MKKFIFLALTILALSGCSMLGNPDRVDLAVQYASLKVIDGQPSKAKELERQLTEFRDDLIRLNSVTVDDFSVLVGRAIVRSGLDDADTFLVLQFVPMLEAELQQYQSEGLLSPDALLRLDALYSTAIRTARIYQ